MSGLSLQFILELVDRLSGPAKDAARSLDGFKEAAEGLSGAGGDLQAEGWVEASRAIDTAADAVKGYEFAVIGASANDNAAVSWVDAGRAIVSAAAAVKTYESAVIGASGENDNLGESWIAAGRVIIAAAEDVKSFETASANAAERADAITAAWRRANEQIDYAIGAAREFDEASAGGGGGRGPRRPGGSGGHEKGSKFGEALETTADLIGIMEAPKAIEHMWGAGAAIQGEEVNQKISGMTPAQIAEAHSRAVGYAQTYKLFGVAEIEHNIREGRTVFTTDADAKELTPDILKLATLREKAAPGSGMESAYGFTRAIEEAGISANAQRAHQFYDDAARAMNFFGGTISGEDYQLAFNRAGIYGRSWDRDFTRYTLPHLLQAFHGDVTGTMLGTFGQMVVGGHMSGPELAALEDLGMIDENKVSKRDKEGHALRIKPGAIEGTDLAIRDPYEFAKFMGDKMTSAGKSETEQVELLTTIFGNRNAAKAIYSLMHDTAQVERTREGIDNPENKGLEAFKDVSGDVSSGFTMLKTSLENLAEVASAPMMAPLAHGLDMLSGGISRMTSALDGHPVEETALSLGATGALAYWGWKAFTGIGSKIGSWFGGGGAAAEGAAEGAAGLGGEGATIGAAGLGVLGLPTLGVGTALYELLDPNSLLNTTLNSAIAHAAWTNPTHGVDWSNPAERETALTQEYARQTDQHPILHGERDMEGAAGRAYAELARAQDEAAAKAAEPIAPKVDASAIDALNAKLQLAVRLLGQVAGGVAQGYTLGPGGASARGGALHDGPEAR